MNIILPAVLFTLVLGAFVYVVLPRAKGWQGALSTAIFVLLVIVAYAGSGELQGLPKPLRLEWRGMDKAQVMAAVPVENVAIYVWVTGAGSSEPRAYVLPWSQKTAQQLQDALSRAEADGTGVEMAMGQETGDGEPLFYARPQPPMPPKDYGHGPAAMPYAP